MKSVVKSMPRYDSGNLEIILSSLPAWRKVGSQLTPIYEHFDATIIAVVATLKEEIQ